MEFLYGLLGVLIGAAVPWAKEEWHRYRSRKEHARYLAVRIICILDEYVGKCVAIVDDDGRTIEGEASHRDENGQDYYLPVHQLPVAPDFPADLDWKSIDSTLMYRILTYPKSVRGENNSIQWVDRELAFPPDYEELFEARQEGYARLGLEAIEIAEELRRLFELPEASHLGREPDWNAKKHFIDKLDQIEKNQIEQNERFAAWHAPAKKEKKEAS